MISAQTCICVEQVDTLIAVEGSSHRIVIAASEGCTNVSLPLVLRLQHCTQNKCRHLTDMMSDGQQFAVDRATAG